MESPGRSIGRGSILVGITAALMVGAFAAPATATRVGAAGSKWTEITPSHLGTLDAVSAVSNHDLWAVGWYYDQPQGRYLPMAEHWNGVTFTTFIAPTGSDGYNAFQGVAAVASDDVWAVGYETPVYYTYIDHPLIEHWNGTKWRVVDSPFKGEGELTAVVADSADDVWAVGFRSENPYGSLLMHWDGSAWKLFDDGHSTDNTIVRAAVTFGPNDLWAAGSTSSNGEVVAFAEHWDGSSWTGHLAQPGDEYDEFNAIAADDGGLFGVGWQSPGLGYFDMAQRFDGDAWTMAPPPRWPYNNNLYGVAVAGARAWAVGYGSESGGPRTLVLRWSSKGWRAEALPVSGGAVLYAIARVGKRLWAVGDSLVLVRSLSR